jgi:hypothetical protein
MFRWRAWRSWRVPELKIELTPQELTELVATERKLYGYVIHVAGETGDGLFVTYTSDPEAVAMNLSHGAPYKIVEVYA